MEFNAAHKASIPNPALTPFSVLIGEWQTEATHPYLPGKIFHGHAIFEWEGDLELIFTRIR